MDVRRLLPKSKTWRVVTIAIATLMMGSSTLYLFLFVEEVFSAREASKMLSSLELLRLGDPATEFERSVRGCKLEKTDYGYACEMIAGAFRFEEPWKLMQRLPDDWTYALGEFLGRAGLRYWRLAVFATIHEERIQSVSVSFFVEGRYESLGAHWGISEHLPARYEEEWKLNADQRRTYMGWNHITSFPKSGEGFTIQATADSTEKELRARHISRGCLLSFRGCDGLCELLPDAMPVLNDRNQTPWGGCTGVPRSHCDSGGCPAPIRH